MKLLKDILYRAGLQDVHGSTDVAVRSVSLDSREAKKYSLFVAVPGTKVDGHQFIEQAVKKGAIAIVCEKMPKEKDPGITYVQVKNCKKALGYIAANFYDNPSEKLKLVGVTGTNGKTTIVTLLYQLHRSLGFKTGMISTVVNKVNDTEVHATHTTPDALSLNKLLVKMVDAGCQYCFMEVSSHAVDQERVTGLRFTGGIFTNLSHDHLDYHGTFDNYLRAKKKFFDNLPKDAFALTNVDDRNGKVMLQNTRARQQTYGLKTMADFKAKIMENQLTGLMLNINGHEVVTRLIGTFNAYNLLAVYATTILLGQEEMGTLTALSNLKPVDGRFQFIKTENNVIGIVDYAHTPDALENVLKNIKSLRTGNETVITVVGCGGDRDKGKRPLMAEIASEFSDKVILTSDNPRTEDPDIIIKDMKDGLDPVQLKKTVSITDRKEAIKTACIMAKGGDIILVAGKGHEKYQEINGKKLPFDDLEILKQNLAQMC